MSRTFDVAVVGGGIVGAALALRLTRAARLEAANILLVEPEPPAPVMAGAPFDLRVSAISPGNRAQLAALGAWSAMDAGRIANYERMVVWHEAVPPDSPDVLRFDAAELGEPDLGSIVENRALQSALLARCAAAGVCIRREALQGLGVGADAAHLEFAGEVLHAELVVGADGAASRVRSALGMASVGHDYHQRGIVATVRSARSHQHTAWQRFLSTGPLALLPLASGECSIVWSAVNERAATLMQLSPAQFAAELTAASAGVLGALELTSERAAFALRRVSATRYAAPRAALVGDAAHVIHPLAGQGVNQGLQDAFSLADVLAQRPSRESTGALTGLLRYERERRAANALMGAMVDGFDGVFTSASAFTAWAAREGLALVGRSSAARRFFFTRAAAGRSSLRR